MTQAARGSGQRQQNPAQQQTDRDSSERQAQQSSSFYDPLPLGTNAFMAPLAPAAEPRTFALRRIAMWCVLGALAGASAGGIVLAFLMDREAAAAEAGGHAVAIAPARARAPRESKPARVVAAVAEPEHVSAATAEAGPASALPVALPNPPSAPSADDAAGAPQPANAGGAARAAGDSHDRASSARRAEPPGEPLVDKPSRAQVIAAMARVQPAVRACLPNGHGMATADLIILGRTGRITSAQVSGQVGPVGSCIARAVRSATFPKFTAESITVRYPMSH